jgi:hypothetical protein
LDERFGAPEMVEAAIKERLSSFPRIGNKDNKKLYELVDIMIEIESLMADLTNFLHKVKNQREWWEWHTVLFLVICRPHCPLFLNVVILMR